MVGIAFDCVLMKGGRQLPLQASLQAVGLPRNPFENYNKSANRTVPDFQLLKMPWDNAANKFATASVRGFEHLAFMPLSTRHRVAAGGALDQGSHGVFGLRGVCLDSSLQENVFRSSTKNIHLDAGTQLVLQTQ